MTFWLSKGCKNDYREVAEGHWSRLPRRIVSRGSSPASAAKPARPRTSQWPPCYYYSNLWHTHTHGAQAAAAAGESKNESTSNMWFHTSRMSVISWNTWTLQLSLLHQCIKIYFSFFFPHGKSLSRFSFFFFAYNTAFGINTGTGNRTLRLIWHTECQHETARRRHKARALLASTVYVFY